MTRYTSSLKRVKVMKNKKKLKNCHRLKETKENDSLMHCVILIWILDQKKDIGGTIDEM